MILPIGGQIHLRREAMRVRLSLHCLGVAYLLVFVSTLMAQDLGPQFKKIKEGIYVQSASETNSNCGIILTQDGVVLIDSGHNPTDSRAVLEAVKKLTPLPIRFLINTEVHPDHTTGHFVFSPPAVIINHAGASEAMKKAYDPERINTLMKQSPEMREAAQGYRLITPQIEYTEKMTLHLGERTLELLRLKNVHSEADTAIWLPQERVLFAASVAVPNSLNNIRPFVTIPDMLAGMKRMKSLNPEIVIPGHGSPGTTKIFDDAERYYGLLLERVGTMAREGKSLDQIKQELRMPEYDSWAGKDRMPTNIEAAYRAVKSTP
jgi:cyclase